MCRAIRVQDQAEVASSSIYQHEDQDQMGGPRRVGGRVVQDSQQRRATSVDS
jgi:hypothetical protein